MCENKLLCTIRNILIGLVLVATLGGTILATVTIVCPNKLHGAAQSYQTIKHSNMFSGWNYRANLKPQNFFIES